MAGGPADSCENKHARTRALAAVNRCAQACTHLKQSCTHRNDPSSNTKHKLAHTDTIHTRIQTKYEWTDIISVSTTINVAVTILVLSRVNTNSVTTLLPLFFYC